MDVKKYRIVFMGTPIMAAEVLKTLIAEDYNIVGVVAQPDKPIGRKKIVHPVPTKIIAQKFNIPVFQPLKIRQDFATIRLWKPDLILTLAYGQIVPQELLDIPHLGCINLHGSLLPKYRGAAPIQYAIINGDKVTGMTLMEMIDKMDAGRMFISKSVNIEKYDTLTTLTFKLTECAKKLIVEALPLYLEGKLEGKYQDESLVTFAPSIKREEEHLDLNKNADTIVNWIKALNNHPGAYLYLDDYKIKIWEAHVINNLVEGEIGEIISLSKNGIVMQAKDGQISITSLQKEGRSQVTAIEFINGNHDLIGKKLF